MRGEAQAAARGRRAAITIPAVIVAAALSVACQTSLTHRTISADQAVKAIAGASEAAEIAALPDGAGKTLVTERCLLCHGAALITQQRKDAAAWGRTVTQMRTWGTSIQDQEQATLITYLSEHFGSGGVRR